MKKRIFNQTEESIVIEPGEGIDIYGTSETKRLMSSRREELFVERVENYE